MKALDVDPGDLKVVLRILKRHVPDCDVFAFGSRVSGKARKASDLDLVLIAAKRLETLRMADLREAFSESDLPFKVDLVDLAGIKENFRKIILQNRVKIRSAQKTKGVRSR